ncbi:MAG TPA: sigma 54-interacting transcriptional regulator [Tepidisphaeraceae bacterium]|nr:sigma 54-interacting transcriptional regulator [Tepidisphaeraceae bacterium]
MRTSGLPGAVPAAAGDYCAFGKSPLVGNSDAMAAIKAVANTVARRQCTVMILGETGTGKEMLARYLHSQSDRRQYPFVPVDCSALTDHLFVSELFGHKKGAFTGAIRDSLGFVRTANGGTLFFDEIGELSLPIQAKLLRMIQERVVVPVGDTRAYPVDVRILAATHRDLASMVKQGTFRQDLYFRLNVVAINLPPLRERADDVVELANHFLKSQAQLYQEPLRQLDIQAQTALASYTWPGNVRELANVMEHAHVLATDQTIHLSDLPPRLQDIESPIPAVSDLNLLEIERRTISEALRRTNYRKTAACRLLGINIQRLNRRILHLNIPLP